MVEILIFFIAASLLLYAVLGGADYGAGILELIPSGKQSDPQRALINRAMGPVWEANHMWLIIVVVILFMGFPPLFEIVMTHLHLPVVALLAGIVVRGTAFTFRHYDAIQEPRSQRVYSVLFGLSSLWSTLWVGVIAGAVIRGQFDLKAQDFWGAYVAPWWGVFPLALGVFVTLGSAFLASMYLTGETTDAALRKHFLSRGQKLNGGVVVSGAFVFFASFWEGGDLLARFVASPISCAALVLATVLFALLWRLAPRGETVWIRVAAAGQIALILLGWYALQGSTAFKVGNTRLSFFENAAPAATLRQLSLALCIGSLFIFPSLFYLMRVFKTRR